MTSELTKKIINNAFSDGVFCFFVEINGEIVNTVKLTKSRLVIGSNSSAEIKIEHEDVSNIHAVVEATEDGKLYIYDLASELGIIRNGEKIISTEINNNDQFEIGLVKIRVKKMAMPRMPGVTKPVQSQTPSQPAVPVLDSSMAKQEKSESKVEVSQPNQSAPSDKAASSKPKLPVKPLSPKLTQPHAQQTTSATTPVAATTSAAPAQAEINEVIVEKIQESKHKTFSQKAEKTIEEKIQGHKPEGIEYVTDEETRPLLLEDPKGIEQIFDYKKVHQKALQVVMYYHDTIMQVSHFLKEEKITFGESGKSDFLVPGVFGEGEFPIVSGKNGEFVLNITPKIKGAIIRENRVLDIKEIGGQGNGSIPLKQKDLVKLIVGSLTFFLSFTEAPPGLKAQRIVDKDALLFKTLIISLVFSIAGIVGISKVKVSDQIEIEQLPERVATMIYEPIKPQPKIEKPKPVAQAKPEKSLTPPEKIDTSKAKAGAENQKKKEVAQAPKPQLPTKLPENKKAGGQGEGAKHSGAAGKMGEETAKNKGQASLKAETPGTGEKAPADRQNLGKSQVAGQGVVDALKGATGSISSLLAGGSENLKGAGKKLQGYGGFTTQGSGGLALEGSGKGGGGDSETFGLSNKGVGAGHTGKGLGQMGEGGGIVGGRGKLTVDTSGGAEETIVLGSIDKDIIARLIKERADQIRYCYEKELNTNPNLAGRISVRFVIGAIGSVTKSGVAQNTMNNHDVGECITKVIESIRFPAPKGGGIAEVSYPFLFKPSHK